MEEVAAALSPHRVERRKARALPWRKAQRGTSRRAEDLGRKGRLSHAVESHSLGKATTGGYRHHDAKVRDRSSHSSRLLAV